MHLQPRWASASILAIACFSLLSGCEKAAPAAAPSVQKVGVFTVSTQAVSVTSELPGRTSAYQIAEVRPQVGGIVQQRLFREGGDVKAGETLYQIDAAPFKAAYDSAVAAHAKAEANLASVKLKAERYADLVKINAVSKQDYDDADAALKQSQADVAATKASEDAARINLNYTRITSPISGRIGKSTVTPGALLTASQATALATVQQLDPIYVDVTQSSTELMALKRALESGQIQRAGNDTAKVKLVLEDGTTYPHDGKLEFSDVTVDPGTSTVTIRAVFPNPHHDLLPGMFVRAVLQQGVNTKGLLVPQQGVARNTRGEATALVLNGEGKVEQRTLEVGDAVGDKWTVKSGLNVGDKLIVEGLQKVKPGASAEAVPAGNLNTAKQ